MAGLPEDPEALPLRRVYAFLETRGLADEANVIRLSQDKLGSYTSTLKRAKVVALLKDKSLLAEFVTAHWPNGETDRGKQLIERYSAIHQRFLAGDTEDEEEVAEEDVDETRFAYETDLRDYLAKNLQRIEKGLTLWPVEAGKNAVEYSIDTSGRRIDILARDSAGVPVIIELKVSRGHERTIGQALYYRTRIKEVMNAAEARIIIVAREISVELAKAAVDIGWISLFEYRLSMEVSPVK